MVAISVHTHWVLSCLRFHGRFYFEPDHHHDNNSRSNLTGRDFVGRFTGVKPTKVNQTDRGADAYPVRAHIAACVFSLRACIAPTVPRPLYANAHRAHTVDVGQSQTRNWFAQMLTHLERQTYIRAAPSGLNPSALLDVLWCNASAYARAQGECGVGETDCPMMNASAELSGQVPR